MGKMEIIDSNCYPAMNSGPSTKYGGDIERANFINLLCMNISLP